MLADWELRALKMAARLLDTVVSSQTLIATQTHHVAAAGNAAALGIVMGAIHTVLRADEFARDAQATEEKKDESVNHP